MRYFPPLFSCLKLPSLLVFVCSLLCIAQSTHAAEDGLEQLLFVEPPNWHEVYEGRDESLSTTEYVPEGQELGDWKEMLTVQIALGFANQQPAEMLSRIGIQLGTECEQDFDVQPIQLGGVGDYPTMAVMATCGKRKELSKGEVSLIRGISGTENFYILRKTWLLDPFTKQDEPPVKLDDRKFWLGFLAYLRICHPEAGNCPKDVAE